MKKLFLILAAVGVMGFSAVNVYAQEAETQAPEAEATEQVAAEVETEVVGINPETEVEGTPMHQAIKQKFLEGGAGWMTPVLLCLIFGLAIAIERILYLNLASINTKKFMAQIEEALKKGGVPAAMEIARNQRGPVASIYYQGLSRYGEGLEVVEKSVASYGSVQMGLMEKGSYVDFALHRPLPYVGIYGYCGRHDSGFRRHSGSRRRVRYLGGRRYQGGPSDDARRSYRGCHPAVVL